MTDSVWWDFFQFGLEVIGVFWLVIFIMGRFSRWVEKIERRNVR